jgi:hypothetical protein
MKVIRTVFRLAAAMAAYASLAGQLAVILQYPGTSDLGRILANYFSYFTIQTNLLIALWFTLGFFRMDRPLSGFLEGARLAIIAYGTVTMVVFWTLLYGRHPIAPGLAWWANLGLHLVLPLAMWLDLALQPPARVLPRRFVPLVLSFPLAYAAWSLTRGLLTGWFPYFFIDPRVVGGLAAVGLVMAGLMAVFLLLGFLLRLIAKFLTSRIPAAAREG